MAEAASELFEKSQTGIQALRAMLRGSLLTVSFLTLREAKSLNYQLFDKLNKRTHGASHYFFS